MPHRKPRGRIANDSILDAHAASSPAVSRTSFASKEEAGGRSAVAWASMSSIARRMLCAPAVLQGQPWLVVALCCKSARLALPQERWCKCGRAKLIGIAMRAAQAVQLNLRLSLLVSFNAGFVGMSGICTLAPTASRPSNMARTRRRHRGTDGEARGTCTLKRTNSRRRHSVAMTHPQTAPTGSLSIGAGIQARRSLEAAEEKQATSQRRSRAARPRPARPARSAEKSA